MVAVERARREVEAAYTAVAPELGEGQTSVGMKVQLDHLAPTAIGTEVTTEANPDSVDAESLAQVEHAL